MLHFGLEVFKIYKIFINFFFLTTSNKFAIQNNPFRQLCLIFHKTLNKLKVWKFRSHRLDIFQYLKKIVTGVEGERKFCFVFIIHFVCTLSFQYKLNYHTSLFYCNFLFIFFCCPTRFFSSAILLFLFSFFFVNLMNICKWIVPLIVYYM